MPRSLRLTLARGLTLVTGLALLGAGAARAQAPAAAPAEIKIGMLHASSGPYAAISMPVYDGMRIWVDQINAGGGVMVKPFGRKIPVRLVTYDDQSNPGTAATLTDQLISQDKVDILMSDSGSVLVAVAVPIAREHKMLLWNTTGTGAPFFTKDNPYIALLADPASTIWPKYIADFLLRDAAAAGLKRVALLYSTNDFTNTQANSLRGFLKAGGDKVSIVYDQGVPTSTSNYNVILNNIAAAKPDAVVELGYVGNDIAFLRALQDGGQAFPFVFTIYSGLELDEVAKNVGASGLEGVFTYVTGAYVDYKPTTGMTNAEYRALWEKTYPGGHVEYGINAIAGYMSGLAVERTLAVTDSMAQLDLRKALFSLSGNMRTLDGNFALDDMGAQVGEITPLGQLVSDGKGGLKVNVVYPPDVATAKPVIGAK